MFGVQKQGFGGAKQSFAEITVFGIRKLCFWSENLVSGQETLFGYKKQSFGFRKLRSREFTHLACHIHRLDTLYLAANPLARGDLQFDPDSL